jgi:quercetin dioxygenase-like cupin family protein
MKRFDFSTMKGGWFVGNFSPTAFTTSACEVSFKRHKKGEYVAPHIHKVASEINYLVRGKMTIGTTTMVAGDIFVIEPEEIADPQYLEDCELVVVKVPCIKGAKYEAVQKAR